MTLREFLPNIVVQQPALLQFLSPNPAEAGQLVQTDLHVQDLALYVLRVSDEFVPMQIGR